MSTKKLLKFLNYGVGIVSLCFLLSTNAYAVWYSGKVNQVLPRASGDIVIQVYPGSNETRFVGLTRILVLAQDPGSSKIMSVFLTALALNTEVQFDVPGVPNWGFAEVVDAAGVKAP